MKDHSKPKVSVCMLAYNNSDYVEQAIQSVLAQQVNFPVELVISEDCSTDDCAEKIKRFKDTGFVEIKANFNKCNLGLTKNLAVALSLCKGEYIAFLDNDDYWSDPFKLSKQVEFLNTRAEVVLCYHPVKLLVDGKLIEDTIGKRAMITDIKELAKGNFIRSSSMLFRSAAFDGFPKEYFSSPVNDYFLLMLVAKHGLIGRLNEVMSVYRLHVKSDWSSRVDQDPAILKYLECMIGLFDDDVNKIMSDRHKVISCRRFLDKISEPEFDSRLMQATKYGSDLLQSLLAENLRSRSISSRFSELLRVLVKRVIS